MSDVVDVEDDLDARAEEYVRARATAGPAEALRLREEFLRSGLPLAARLASRYRGRGEPAEDLEQVARIGLVKSGDRYDAGRGSFTAFAVVTIRGELRRHFRDHTWSVHVPRRLQDLGLEMKRATDDLTARLSRPPTDAECAERLSIAESEVRAVRVSSAAYVSASLNRHVSADDGTEIGELLGAPDPALLAVEDRTTVRSLLLCMPRRERRMLALRFWGNQSQAEIAEGFGISQMQVSRLINRALAWMRAGLLADVVPPWQGDEDDLGVRVAACTGPGRVRIVRVRGEVGHDNATALRTRLLAALSAGRPHRLVVDLAGVPSLDAAGLGALASVWEVARERRVRWLLTGASPDLSREMTVVGLGFLLER